MKSSWLIKVMFLLLIILNLVLMAFIWFHRPWEVPTAPRPDAPSFLIRELHMTNSQQTKFRQLLNNHRMILGKLQLMDRILHKRFFDQLLISPADTHKVSALADSIASVRKNMEVLTYDHFLSIRNMLDVRQQEKFDRIFNQTLRMVIPPPPPPPLPPPPPPPAPIP